MNQIVEKKVKNNCIYLSLFIYLLYLFNIDLGLFSLIL